MADFSREPDYRWEIAGGPALLPDFPESRTPEDIVSLLKAQGIWGKPIGLYRLVAKQGIPDEVWRGDLGPLTALTEVSSGGTTIRVEQRDIDWRSLVQRLTFGAYDLILDVKLPHPQSSFWRPHITRDLGFAPADRSNRRFCHYLELSPHLDEAAWDERSIPTRVAIDLRRDFAQAFAKQSYGPGGTGPSVHPPYGSSAFMTASACWRRRLHSSPCSSQKHLTRMKRCFIDSYKRLRSSWMCTVT